MIADTATDAYLLLRIFDLLEFVVFGGIALGAFALWLGASSSEETEDDEN